MRRAFIIITALLTGILILGGCNPGGIEGPEPLNMRPVVHFVNIPVEGAKFSSDTTVYWYGTDVDGFITMFKYAVVESTVVGDPDVYIQTTDDSAFGWIELEVELNNPQTNDKVKMSADVSDPVRKYVASYIFLQAIDNLGAGSEIVYRLFRKNNHFPDTKMSARGLNDPYVNAVSGAGVLDGVSFSWSGEDKIDYPRNPPPFQYQWKFYGPYDTLDMVELTNICVGSVFVDIYGDFYYDCDSLVTNIDVDTIIVEIPPDSADTTIEFDTTFTPVCSLSRKSSYGEWGEFFYFDSIPANLDRLVEESYDPLTGESWVYGENVNIYDVFRDTVIDTTSQMYFLVWCQARDDSKVPDPVPVFSWVSVIEPRFERDVIVVDFSAYKRYTSGFWNWPAFPRNPFPTDIIPEVKTVIGNMVEEWLQDENAFDADNILPDITYTLPGGTICRVRYEQYQSTQDYYPVVPLDNCASSNGIAVVSLRDILKHKIIILVKDNPGGQLPVDNPVMLSVMDGLSAGMSCWAMLRSPFQSFTYFDTTSWPAVPVAYQQYFGVEEMRHQGWQGAINKDLENPNIRIEDFGGADILEEYEGVFPHLPIDVTLLEQSYLWVAGAGFLQFDFRCAVTGEVLIGALPEVGIVRKNLFAEALYLYETVHKDRGGYPFMTEDSCGGVDIGIWDKSHGGVVGIRYNTGLYRTAHFSFSLLPIVRDSGQAVFSTMMDWLAVQPYIQTGKLASDAPAKLNRESLRAISAELHALKKEGLLRGCDPEQ